MATEAPKVNLNKAADFVSKNMTPILYVGGAILVIFLVKKLFSGFFGKDDQTDTGDMDIVTSRLSITNDQATQIAKNMFDAMNRLGTDEKTLFDAVTPLNSEDLKLVVKTFGLKSYFGHGYGALLGQDKSLQGWLKAELSNRESERMKALFDEREVPY